MQLIESFAEHALVDNSDLQLIVDNLYRCFGCVSGWRSGQMFQAGVADIPNSYSNSSAQVLASRRVVPDGYMSLV